MRPIYLFDDGKGDLSPLTALRASFQVRVGPLSLLERFLEPEQAPEGFMLWGLLVPPGLEGICREASGLAINELRSGGVGEPVLVVNGRCVLPPWERLAALRSGTALIEAESGDLIAACVPEADVPETVSGNGGGLEIERLSGRWLMTRPWHARSFRDAAIREGLGALRGLEALRPGMVSGVLVLGGNPVMAAATARVYPGAILDAESGPIAIGEGATIRPGSTVVGPAYVGPHSTVLDRAVIRGNTVIGPWCKVAGEVSGTIFQGYANKAHDGFLGDSWVGEWANLGAGTTNSNLLNTYDQVIARATPDGPNERTGEQFLGAVIGDHVKTAICTRIMTGAVIHTGAMIARTQPVVGCISPFAWMTDEANRKYRLSKFVEVARAAMGRRGVTPSPAYLERLAAIAEDGAGV